MYDSRSDALFVHRFTSRQQSLQMDPQFAYALDHLSALYRKKSEIMASGPSSTDQAGGYRTRGRDEDSRSIEEPAIPIQRPIQQTRLAARALEPHQTRARAA